MTFTVLWTLLPNGYDSTAAGKLRLSLVASPRIADNRGSLTDSPLRDWPAFVAGLPTLRIATKGSDELIPVTRATGPAPDSQLWRAMFGATTRVAKRGLDDRPPQIAPSPASFVRAAQSLDAIFAGDNLVAQRAIAAIREVDADLAGPMADLETAMSRLGAVGRREEALALPLAAYARALRSEPARPGVRAARPLAGVAPIAAADFHQVVGLLLTHPRLALAVGLRIDLLIDAFEGARAIRVVGPDGNPLNGQLPQRQPWSHVRADPGKRRFTMEPGPSADPEVVGGVLAVAGNPAYSVATTDVVGTSLQLYAQAMSARPDGGVIDDRLPVRRDVGIMIARRDRPATVIGPRLARSADLHADLVSAQPGDIDLYADDVTSGFRVDVKSGAGPYRSLMARRVRYTVGGQSLPVQQDEGRIEPFAGVEQTDENGVAQLTAGEEIVTWDGWGLAADRPGPKVETQPGSPVTTSVVTPVTMPGYQLTTEVEPAPGSLPRLRFGQDYRVRMRAVDLAGNSIDPAVADPAQEIDAGRFLRHEAVPAPVSVPRRRYVEGESLNHLVIRSDDGVASSPCERHLAAPNCPQRLAELHGLFDSALGNNRGNQGIRDQILALASREAGSFLDPVVPDVNGQPVPAPGIAVVTNDPAAPPPVELPVPRGEALPNGAYVIHNADAVNLPYLPDPIAAGVALIGFPGTQGPVVATYSGAAWPDVRPTRLIVRPTTKTNSQTSATVEVIGGRQTLVLTVPPGFRADLELSSTIWSGLVGQLATGTATVKEVTTGLVPQLSARQPITVVHAVRKPTVAPAFAGPVPKPATAIGKPGYTATFKVTAHEATSARVDIEASWREVVDPGTGDLVDESRLIGIGSATVDPAGSGPFDVSISQLFGDTRHRTLTLGLWATTRFREYFPPADPGDRSLQRSGASTMSLSIPHRGRPAPPDVHSVIPLFRWNRGVDADNRRFGERRTEGLRVYLRRPWLATGEGELLGVVIHPDPAIAGDPAFAKRQSLVTRWGSDPLERTPDASPVSITAGQFTGAARTDTLALVDATVAGAKATIVGYPVSYDADRELWYADVRLNIPDEVWPFVRLGLVRYQPESLSGCALSPIVQTDFAQLPPTRRVTFVKEGAFGVRVQVTGRRTEGANFTVRQERWMPDAFDASSGLASDVGVGGADGWTVTPGPVGANLRANLLLTWTASGAPAATVVNELRAGRLVVEETQDGLALLSNSTARRAVFTETIDRSLIGIGSA